MKNNKISSPLEGNIVLSRKVKKAVCTTCLCLLSQTTLLLMGYNVFIWVLNIIRHHTYISEQNPDCYASCYASSTKENNGWMI